MDITLINQIEVELVRFQSRLKDAKKVYQQAEPPYKSQEAASLRRSAMDLKAVLHKLGRG
jgi:hypothetical protein